MIRLILAGERPASWNIFYSGQHWSKRRAEAERVHWLVRAAIPAGIQMITVPVKITLLAYFDKRPLDASNIAVKFYEDGLLGHLIQDDTPRFVRSVETVSLIDRRNPRVELVLEEVVA